MTALRTLTCKLIVLPVQEPLLEETIAAFSQACAYTFGYGRQHQLNQQLALHRAYYFYLRSRFLLPANLAVRAIAWAALHLRKAPAAPCPSLPNQVLFDSRTLRLQAKEGWVKLTLLERQEKFYLDKSSFPASYLEGFGSATVTLLKRSGGTT